MIYTVGYGVSRYDIEDAEQRGMRHDGNNAT